MHSFGMTVTTGNGFYQMTRTIGFFKGMLFLIFFVLLIQRNITGRVKKIVQEMIDASLSAKWESRISTTKFAALEGAFGISL
jgi:hypothetical protein